MNKGQNYSNKLIPSYPSLTPEIIDNKRFFILEGPEETKLWKEIDVIPANKDLRKALKGRPKRVNELKNGNILVEVENKEQSDRIRRVKKLGGLNVSVSEHKTLNSTKGTIHAKRFCDIDEKELLAELAEDHVTDVYKIKRREGDSLINTGTMILTFDHFALPQKVSIGWVYYDVREYIPNPRRCFKCQRYGHGTKVCRSQEDRCANCGEFGHMDRGCSNPTNCCNCEEPHPSYSKKCQTYLQEKEILTVMTKEKMSYPEAKKKLGISTLPRRTYANAVTQNVTKSINRTTPLNQEKHIPIEENDVIEINVNQQITPSTSGGNTATKVAAAATKATTTPVAPNAAIAEGKGSTTTKPSAPKEQPPIALPLQNSKRKGTSPTPSREKTPTAMEPPPKKTPLEDKDKAAKQPKQKPPSSSKMEVDAPTEVINKGYKKIPTISSMRK